MYSKTKLWSLIICLFGAIAVGLGAFGAHLLADTLSEYALSIYQTGVLYHFIHVLAALIALLLSLKFRNRLCFIAVQLFLLGIILFSGSLYLLALREVFSLGSLAGILGPITPLGGITFIIAWLLLGIGIYKSAVDENH